MNPQGLRAKPALLPRCLERAESLGELKHRKVLKKCFVLLFLVQLIQSSNAQTPSGKETRSEKNTTSTSILLEVNKPIENTIIGGNTQSYGISASAGALVSVSLEQQGIDIAETVLKPDGSLLADFDSELLPRNVDHVTFVADTAGVFTLQVRAKIRDAAGIYQLLLVRSQPATEQDRSLDQTHRLGTQSALAFRYGRYDEAISLGNRAVQTAEKVLGQDDEYVGDLLNQLGFMQREKGDYTQAESTLQRALVVNEKKLGREHPQTGYSYICLGLVYLSRNDYQKAERMLRTDLESHEKALGPNHPTVAFQWLNLASLHLGLGDYQLAEKEFQHTLTIAEKLLDPYDRVKAAALNNLGWLYINTKDYDRAERCSLESLNFYEETRGPEHPGVVSPLMNLGVIARAKKEYARALEFYYRALTVSEKTLGSEHLSVGSLLNNIANIHKARGDYVNALQFQQRALAIAEKSGGPYHILTLTSIGNIANLYRVQGDVANAIAFQTLLDERLETALTLNLAIGSERQKLAYFDSLAERTNRTISLHLNVAPGEPSAASLAALVLLQRKGRILDAVSQSLSALRERSDPEDQKLLDQFNSTAAQLAKLMLAGPQQYDPADYQQQLKVLQEQKETLEATISERSLDFRLRVQPVTLPAVQSAIPPGASLIEFAAYRPFDPRVEGNQYGEPRYVAYVLRQHGEVRWRELGSAKEIDASVDSLREALRDPQRKDVRQLSRRVDQQIMQPLRDLLGDSTQLIISPDGQLNLIPFAALLDENENYLVQRYTITYITTGRDLLRKRFARESKSGPLIIANPAFGDPAPERTVETKFDSPNNKRRTVTSARNLSEVYFAPLAATALEANTIKTFFPNATVLTGTLATESAVKRARAPTILHIATHGFFLQPGGDNANETSGGMRGISTNVRIENPLMRSGLALAEANVHTVGTDDGILTAFEASGLNLWGTRLVVLSACDTGLGDVRNGEGVYGLRRAFVLAGAESLVMSLWPVSDRATRELMTSYYENLNKGLGRSEALKQVQLGMLKRNPQLHPFYWANFIQSGDWTSLNSR